VILWCVLTAVGDSYCTRVLVCGCVCGGVGVCLCGWECVCEWVGGCLGGCVGLSWAV
jgi:hypothetical protein